ncbi:hypothetical protein PENSPDRAFT_610098 [Peniophora sp. CONT]|nr:hypothetical protein PENSPDRAFT_610098 [Peniophora sp. CONT]
MTRVEDAHTVWIHGCLELAALAILYHDYFLTLPREIDRIWRSPLSRPSLVFYLNRYVPVLGDIVITVYSFSDFASEETTCRQFALARQILLLFSQSIVCILLAMRIIALYNRSKGIAVFVIGSGVVLLGIACWSVTGGRSFVLEDVPGCHVGMDYYTGSHIAVAWIAQAAFDMIIFGLTVYRTLQTRRFHDGRGLLLSGSGLLDLVWRDGAIYFVTMALANVANIVTFYLLTDGLRGVLSTFAGCISVTMMSRLMLNLYEAATPASTMNSVPADLTRTVTMFFTTRLDGLHDEMYEREYEAAPETVDSHGTTTSGQAPSSGGDTTLAPSTPRNWDWEPPDTPKPRGSRSLKEHTDEYALSELPSDRV